MLRVHRAARNRGGVWIPFTRLSAGVRNMLGLVVDLAVRCAMLNPHLGSEAATKSSGVVLIDELDLHLHPTWQRHVVEDLRAAFPRIQFIATTHSGLLVSSLRASEIITLQLDHETGLVTRDTRERPDPRLSTNSELYMEFFGVDSIYAQHDQEAHQRAVSRRTARAHEGPDPSAIPRRLNATRVRAQPRRAGSAHRVARAAARHRGRAQAGIDDRGPSARASGPLPRSTGPLGGMARDARPTQGPELG